MSTVKTRLRCATTLIAAVATVASLFAVAPTAGATVPSCSSAGIGLASLGGPNFYIDSGSTPQFTSSYTGYRVTNSTGSAMSDVWVSLSNFTGGDLGLAAGQSAAAQISSLAAGSSGSLFWYLNAPTASSTAQGFTVTVYSHAPGLSDATVLCTATGGFNQVIGTLSASANKVTGITISDPTPDLGATFSVSVTGNTGTLGSGPSDNSDPYSLWMSPAVTSAWPASAFRLESTNLNISPDGTAAPVDHPDTLRVADLGPAARSYTATYTFQAIGFTDGPTTVQPVQEIASGTQVKHTGSYSVTLPTIAPPGNTLYLSLSATPTKLDVGGGQVDFSATMHGPVGVSVDSFVVTPPAGGSVVSGSATLGGASIGDPVAKNGSLVFSGPFTLTDPSVPLAFSLDLAATPGDQVTSLVAGLGAALIGTDPSDISGANPATATVNVDTVPTAADFSISAVPSQLTDVDVLAHATDADRSDALTVTDVSPAAHGTAALSDGTVTYQPDAENTSPDTFTYTVSDGRGGTAQGTVTVNVESRTSQTITFPDMPALSVGDTGQAAATSDSGLPVTYSSQTTDVCTVAADTGVVTALAVGTCTIAADQPGNDTYAAAEQATTSFEVDAPLQQRSAQTIDAADQGTVDVTVEQVTLAASADSGLPVTFTSATPEVCSVESSTGVVTLLAAGTCTVTVSQDGSDAYLAATPVDVTFTVDPAAQAVTFTPPAQLLTGPDAFVLTAASDAFLPVSFTVTAGDDVCSVDGADLTVTGTGSCDIQASAEGNDVYAAAAPVTRTIDVVAPSDDSVTLPPTRGQSAAHRIDVLGNDPSGLTLADVGLAAHGTALVDGDEVTYTPDIAFRGVDQFTYSVTDGSGRTASATVSVRVRDAAPTAADATLRQLAGTARRVHIEATDLNGDHLSLTVLHKPASVGVTITGLTVRVAPLASFTGRITISLAVHDGAGGTAHSTVVDTVRPQPVDTGRRTISRHGTHITWSKASAADATYRVRIGRHLVCVTAELSCNTKRMLGPAVPVWVRVVGHDKTFSDRTVAKPVHATKVLVGIVYFASGSWQLDDVQRARLTKLAHRLTRNGFTHVRLNGYTDSIGSIKYNLRLSHQRTETIARMLYRHSRITSRQDWFGKANPAVPGRGAAKNRRVEILVS